MKARFEFYYNQHEKVLQAADGLIDFVHVGEDFGTQRGPTISMAIFEKLFVPKYEKYFKMAHSYGARTLMHMCGAVRAFLPRLIEIGLDIYDVVQPTSPEMDIALLKKEFGEKLTFCGSVCVQSTIAFGTTEDVENQVKRRLDLFPDGGLFLGPTHAIQVGSPIENIVALYKTAGSLTEKIDDKILSIEDPNATVIKDIKISKCF
jgi:uroporphyrinogen decarboxylase